MPLRNTSKIQSILLLIFLIIILILLNYKYYLPKISSKIISSYIKKDVFIQEIDWNFFHHNIEFHKITIKDKILRVEKPLLLSKIKKINLHYDPLLLFTGGLKLDISAQELSIINPESKLLNNIINTLSIKKRGSLEFDSAQLKLFYAKKNLTIEQLLLKGNEIIIILNGSVINFDNIFLNTKILFSKELISSMPEQTRKLFFKESKKSWYKTQLTLKGPIKNPSIYFSTDSPQALFVTTCKHWSYK